jgi:diacylglycerol kinase family enzyme
VPRRLAAIGAILLVVGVIVVTLAIVVGHPLVALAEGILLVALAMAVWFAATRTGGLRALAIVVALGSVVAAVAIAAAATGFLLASLLVRLVALGAAGMLAKYALGTTTGSLKQAETPGTPVGPATHGVLFMNLKSGGGKAERFHLVEECRKRGIEPVVLNPGEDWLRRVHDVSAGGADVVGMAGGDGSQAMVGSVAAELGLPMVVVPAGTRNHLALDLGLDRNDLVGALDAYGEAVERPMDLGDANGHVFVNNVSLGLYAAIVRSPEYRDAKVDTTLAALPDALGPGTEPFDLRFTGPAGEQHTGAHVIQVSNNPYGGGAAGLGSRPRLDTERLGIVTLTIDGDRDAAAAMAAIATGRPERFEGLASWTARTFEVTSDSPIEIGLDGEAEVMDSPLRLSIRTPQVRVRLPKHAIGYSPAARSMGWKSAGLGLWRVVLGRPPEVVAEAVSGKTPA